MCKAWSASPVLASDPEGDGLTYSLRGADAAEFTIGPDSGQLAIAQGAASGLRDARGRTASKSSPPTGISRVRASWSSRSPMSQSCQQRNGRPSLRSTTRPAGDNWTRNDNWDVARTTSADDCGDQELVWASRLNQGELSGFV